MALRITPMRPIERNGLKGFGLSVFIDNSPEEATQSVIPNADAFTSLAAREADESAVSHPNSSADLLPSETDTAGEAPPPISPATPSSKSEVA